MAKTHKIQVTLDDVQYEQLVEIARRENKKLARVVRESIVRYCIEPAATRRKQEALEGLLAVEPTPVPQDYGQWKAEYAGMKGAGGVIADGERAAEGDSPGSDGMSAEREPSAETEGVPAADEPSTEAKDGG